MAAQPPDADIGRLLADLRSDDAVRRAETARKIQILKIPDVGLRQVLKVIANTDPNWQAKSAAHAALRSLRDPRRDRFWIGFVGFYVVNGLAGYLVNQLMATGHITTQGAIASVSAVLLVANLLALILIALQPTWRWAALGIAAALVFDIVGVLGLVLAINLLHDHGIMVGHIVLIELLTSRLASAVG